MIRINLAPQKKGSLPKATRSASSGGGGSDTSWFIAYGAAAVLAGIGCAIFYATTLSDLEEIKVRIASVQGQLDAANQSSADIETVRAALARSQQLETVVAELQRARLGPTRAMIELSRLLSPGGGPSVDPELLERMRRENPHADFNRNWDTRRLWLTSFEEDEKHVRIQGMGKTNEDVAEFLRRIGLSESFTAVALEKTEAFAETTQRMEVVQFNITCDVRY